ncbi:MAG: hypothetical protein OCD01_09945 [Fibrobacterales bacterium]
MELEKDVLLNLVGYLKSHGYPESSLSIEYKIGKYRADLVVIDLKSSLPIQLFEIKSQKNSRSIEFGKKQLKAFLGELEDKDIPTYLVFPSNEMPYFHIEKVQLIENEISNEVESLDILNFNLQKQSRINKKINDTVDLKRTTQNVFQRICFLLAAIVFMVFLAHKFTCFELNSIDVSLLGATIALIVIPFSNKLKILGVEFERYNSSK